MNEADKQYFKEQAKKPAPDGFVCIGVGMYRDRALKDFFGGFVGVSSSGNSNYSLDNPPLTHNWSGTTYGILYYVTKERWEQYVGKGRSKPAPPPAPPRPSIPEQIKYAESFVNKIVKYDGKRYNLGKVEYFKDTEEFDQEDPYVKGANKIIEEQGIVLGLRDADDWVFFAHPIDYPLVLAPKVVVNGHPAVDKGTYYEFGCARITKPQLEYARSFLQGAADGPAKDNRTIDAVVIGAGKFDLKTLNELL